MIGDLIRGWKELEDAQDVYETAEAYYEGTFGEYFNSKRIERLIGKTGEKYRLPLIAATVDVLADRCEIMRVSAPKDTAATQAIEEVTEANNLAAHYPDLITKTFEYGDGYLQVWPVYDTTETPEPAATAADEELLAVGIEFTVRDPKNCRVFYDPENQRRKAFGLIRWAIEDDREQELWRVDLFYPEVIERWISKPNTQPEEKASWEPYADENEGWSFANQLGEIPLHHFRTRLPYGMPVHWRGIGAQNSITKMTVTQVTTSESQGFPWRYALTDPDAELDSVNDSPDFPEDDEALADASDGPLARRGGQASNIRTAPGTLNVLQGMASVGQLPAADPDVFMDPADKYVSYLAQLNRTPLHDFQPTAQPPSGESRRIAEGPFGETGSEDANPAAGPADRGLEVSAEASRASGETDSHFVDGAVCGRWCRRLAENPVAANVWGAGEANPDRGRL